MARTVHSPVRVTPTVHSEIVQLSLSLSAEHGRRITMSEVFMAALSVAKAHPAEFAAMFGKVVTSNDQ